MTEKHENTGMTMANFHKTHNYKSMCFTEPYCQKATLLHQSLFTKKHTVDTCKHV